MDSEFNNEKITITNERPIIFLEMEVELGEMVQWRNWKEKLKIRDIKSITQGNNVYKKDLLYEQIVYILTQNYTNNLENK